MEVICFSPSVTPADYL